MLLGGWRVKVYQGLVNSVKRGVISPVYLLFGSESYLRNKAVASLKQHIAGGDLGEFNLTLLDGSQAGLDEIVDAANTLPFFADKRLVIVENLPLFKNKQKKTEPQGAEEEQETASDTVLLKYLQDPNPTTCLVFIADEGINKRKKVVKAIEKAGQVLEFAALKGRELEDWVLDQFSSRGKKIDRGALDYLLAINNDDLGILQGEIEKLSLMNYEQTSITLEQVKQGASTSAEASIFDMVDFIGERKSAQAIEIVREMLSHGEPAIRLLYMVSRQLRLILATKSLAEQGYSQNQLASTLGVHPFVGQKLIRQARNFSIPQLELALEICLEIDLALKSSQGAPAVLLEVGILCICSSQPFGLMA
jgi:DNA polymerase III subunit delta